jgi:hypothetical protein
MLAPQGAVWYSCPVAIKTLDNGKVRRCDIGHPFESSSLATRAVSDVIDSWLQMAKFGKSGIVLFSESQGIDSSTGDDE